MTGDRLDPDVEQALAQQQDLPPVTARADLFAEINASLPTAAPAHAPQAPEGWRRRRPTFAIPAGVARLALVAALIIALAVSGDPPPAARGTLVAHGSSGVHGSVDVFDASGSDGRVVVHLKGLAVAPTGDHYTIWVVREGVREMTPVASIVSGEDARIELPLPGPGRYTARHISLQENDASPVHSSVSVATADLGQPESQRAS